MLRFFSTLRSKLFFSFCTFILLTGCIAVVSIWFYQKRERLGQVLTFIQEITSSTRQAFRYEKDFLLSDVTDPGFYQSGSSEYLARHDEEITTVKNLVSVLKKYPDIKSSGIQEDLVLIEKNIDDYETAFKMMVNKIKTRGFENFGLEEKYARQLEILDMSESDRETFLQLRTYEKDFLLYEDTLYANIFNKKGKEYLRDIKKRNLTEKDKEIVAIFTNYISSFDKVVGLEREIGFNHLTGLKKQLNTLTLNTEDVIHKTNDKAVKEVIELRSSLKITFICILIASVLISLIISYLLTQQIIKPISRLSTHINSIVESRFTGEITPLTVESLDEVGRLTHNFNLMTEEIQQHLQETTKKSKVLQKQNMQLQSINLRLISSENKLRSLNSVKDKFFSIISHDLKGPLHTLTGFLQILIKYTNTFTEAELREFAESMDNSVKRLLTMLENLLQWSRSQTGNIEHKPVTLKLNNVLEDNVNLFTDTARNKEITLILESEGNIWVKADKNMLDFIMRNLISNAIKFTRQGGQVKVLAHSSESFTEITVSDNGVGISPEDLKKLFQPDVHFSTPGTGKEKGTGFGLLLCKDFVEKNGGEISIESIPGKGTSLKFTVPTTEKHPEMVEE